MVNNPDIPRLYQSLRGDSPHVIAAVIILGPGGDGYAHATVEGETGVVLAWDGFYYGGEVDGNAQALADLEWSAWGDMPSKLLIQETDESAHMVMGHWLVPTFSAARRAAQLVMSNADALTTSHAAHVLANGRVVAYIPIVDHEVFEAYAPSWGRDSST